MKTSRVRRPDVAALNHQVAAWNAAHPVGAKVVVRRDNGTGLETVTRSEAWLMGDHSAVVMVNGISGGYSLDRVTPITQPEKTQ